MYSFNHSADCRPFFIVQTSIVQLDSYSDTHHEMRGLLVVVKSHLFPQFVRLN